MTTRWYRIAFAVQAAGIVAVSVAATLGWVPDVRAVHPYADKVLHATGYGLLAFLLAGALGFRRLRAPGLAWLCVGVVVVAVAAGAEEASQLVLPRRNASFADLLANAIGVGAAQVAAWHAARRSAGRVVGGERSGG
jgi:VanZ family protein